MMGLHWMRRLVVGIGAGWGEREGQRERRGVLGSSVTLIGEGRGRG